MPTNYTILVKINLPPGRKQGNRWSIQNKT